MQNKNRMDLSYKLNINNQIRLKSNAKINLALDVVCKRADGYHDLNMIMQTLLLHDDIYMKKIDANKIKIITNLSYLPVDNKNLVYRAIEVMQQQFDLPGGIFVEMTKNIPVSAGLGGGSANCAAALVGMRKLYNLSITNKELCEIGMKLGADVPFLIMQGTALAQGIGERLTKLTPHPYVHVLLAKPNFNVSTPSVFGGIDIAKLPDNAEKLDQMMKNIKVRDVAGVATLFFNDLEQVTEAKYPIITDIKKMMIEYGAMNALMSGSGPTVFGYFKSKAQAIACHKALRTKGIKEVILTGTYNRRLYNKYSYQRGRYKWK